MLDHCCRCPPSVDLFVMRYYNDQRRLANTVSFTWVAPPLMDCLVQIFTIIINFPCLPSWIHTSCLFLSWLHIATMVWVVWAYRRHVQMQTLGFDTDFIRHKKIAAENIGPRLLITQRLHIYILGLSSSTQTAQKVVTRKGHMVSRFKNY